MKMLKKVISLMLSFVILVGISPKIVKADDIKTREQFLQDVMNSVYFNSYKDIMTQEHPIIFNDTTDEEGNITGYIAQYEIILEREENKDDNIHIITNATCLLNFIYIKADDHIVTLLIDYRNIDTDNEITVFNLDIEEKEIIDLNELQDEKLETRANELALFDVTALRNILKACTASSSRE